MSENWQPMYFSEFVEINPTAQLPKDQELPYVEMADVTPGRRYVTARQMRRPRSAARFRDGDTLFARITPCLENGKIAQYVSKGNTLAFGSTEFFVFRAKSGVSDRDYVCYFAMTDLVRKPAEKSMAGASGRQRADIRAIENLKVHVPSLPLQRKIAAILSAYDDLIENNTRRIKILEEMAQSIYREWFVHFRFPGHEKVKMVDSPLGKIPCDWEILPIGNVIETLGGGTPSKKIPGYWEPAEVTWFTPSDLTASKSMFMFDSSGKISQEGLNRSSAKLFPAYSVMMTSRATIGVVSINTVPSCTNQGFIICVPNDRLSLYQIYYWIYENKQLIITISSRAAYKEISRSEFRELPIVIADEETRKAFIEVMDPLCNQIKILSLKNINLRQTRDLLLPRLISGELDVSELDIDIGGLNS